MKVQVEEISVSRRRLNVEVPSHDVQPTINSIASEFVRKAKIPGFRQGKVPSDIVKKRFEEDIKNEVIQRLFQTIYPKVLANQNIKPVFYPIVEKIDVAEGQPMVLSILVDVKPPIKLKKYKGLKLAKILYALPDGKVQETLNYLQSQRATFEPKKDDEVLEWNDSCAVDYAICVEGNTVKEDKKFRTMIVKNHSLKDLIDVLVGLQSGASHTAQVTLSDQFPEESYRGQSAEIEVTVTEAFSRVVPALDDEFAKDMGEFQSLAELRQHIEDDLLESYERRSKQELEETLIKDLIEKNPLEAPLSLVHEEERVLMENMKTRLVQQGVEEKLAQEHLHTLHDEMHGRSEEMVKMQLLFDAIGEKEGIEISDEEVDAAIEERSKAQKQNSDVLKKQMEEQGRLESLVQSLKDDKILAMLVDKAEVKEVKEKIK